MQVASDCGESLKGETEVRKGEKPNKLSGKKMDKGSKRYKRAVKRVWEKVLGLETDQISTAVKVTQDGMIQSCFLEQESSLAIAVWNPRQ